MASRYEELGCGLPVFTAADVARDVANRRECQALYYASLDPVSRAFALGLDLSANATAFLTGPALPVKDTVATTGISPQINFNVGIGIDPAAAAILRGEGAPAMGLLDDIINGVGKVGGAILGGIGEIARVGGNILPGLFPSPVQGPVWTVAPQAPAPSMVNGNTAASGMEAFRVACAADPSCTAAIVAALQGGGMAAMGGMMNGSGMADAMLDAQLAALGFPPALINIVKSTPGLIGRLLPGLGVGAAGAALGSLATNALVPSGMGMRLPRRIQVPDGRGGTREYVSRGRPILYSGDISAARRVTRVAGRARRGRRRTSVRQPVIMLGAGNGVKNVCSKCLTAPCGCS